MEVWLVIAVSVCLAALLKAIFDTRSKPSVQIHLPPGPTAIPFISDFLWLRKSTPELQKTLRSLKQKLGSAIITLPIFPSRPFIFIFSRSLAHKALIENGAVFADRPKALVTGKIFTSNQHTISSAGYGDTWRVLRRDLTSHILHPARIKCFSSARSWVLQTLIQRLRDAQNDALSPVKVVDHFRYAMFCLLVFMCFGERLDDDQIRKIEPVHHQLLLGFSRFQILNLYPWITKLIFYRKWKELYDLKKAQNGAVIPLIRARKQLSQLNQNENLVIPAYVDSLLELELPDGDNNATKRKMTEDEMVVVCSEFLNAGTDTTSTALQWIMANLVKNQQIQTKLFNEISEVVGPLSEIKEEALSKMEYLKAVVLEGLRRHPPAHFLLPHAVTQQTELDGYVVPKNAVVNFMVADIGWDPEAWVDPMEFKPERLLGDEFDLYGTKEIKMMPFGVGRRICPGLGLALFHLEYFVANLVWEFEWKEVDGYEVDLSEKHEFTIVMKHPLHARITPRSRP